MARVYTQPFVLVSAVIEKDGKFLLVKEYAPNNPSHNQWNLPGGGLELGENPVKGVIREVREEAGYAFKPSGVLGIYSSVMKSLASYFKSTPHAVIIVFVGKISGKQGKFIEDEISETGWFSAKEIKNMDKKTLKNMNIKKMVVDFSKGKKFPMSIITHRVSG